MRIPPLQAKVDAEGKSSALDEIYPARAQRVGRSIANLGGPAVYVENSVRDVFLIAQRRLPKFRGEAQITSWLYQITARVVKAAGRRERVGAGSAAFISWISPANTLAPRRPRSTSSSPGKLGQ
jgi:RNA polymerase sigma-70 factor (ECF subfamily)